MALTLNSMLGVRTLAPGSLCYLDDSDLQMVCGRNIVRYDTETRSEKIHQGSADAVGGGFTAVAVSSNRRCVCCVCVSHAHGPRFRRCHRRACAAAPCARRPVRAPALLEQEEPRYSGSPFSPLARATHLSPFPPNPTPTLPSTRFAATRPTPRWRRTAPRP
jgi:hypothetical protein